MVDVISDIWIGRIQKLCSKKFAYTLWYEYKSDRWGKRDSGHGKLTEMLKGSLEAVCTGNLVAVNVWLLEGGTRHLKWSLVTEVGRYAVYHPRTIREKKLVKYEKNHQIWTAS